MLVPPGSWVHSVVLTSTSTCNVSLLAERCILADLQSEYRPWGFAQAVNNHRSRLLSHCSLIMLHFQWPRPHLHHYSSILYSFPAEGIPALTCPLFQRRSQRSSTVVNDSYLLCLHWLISFNCCVMLRHFLTFTFILSSLLSLAK